jgi:predicted nicotinamide N-methyase
MGDRVQDGRPRAEKDQEVSCPSRCAFIKTNTRLVTPPLVPEIRLHLADETLPIWEKTEKELGELNVPPPYWAFAWPGGQALARYLLDTRRLVAGKSVLDLGSGSGLAAIAARKAGAVSVLAGDIDPWAIAAIKLNAAVNGLGVATTPADLLGAAPLGVDVILAGDVFYERGLAERVLVFIERAAANGAQVLIGDPQWGYFPRDRLEKLADYIVPVTRELEDADTRRTAVWQLDGTHAA